jgi:hypothetical protein
VARVVNAVGRVGWRVVIAASLVLCARTAHGQTAAPAAAGNNEIDLARIFAAVPPALERALAEGHTQFFKLLENVELFHFESEIDRMVGGPGTLNDSTTYKLSLLPFQIRYPIYRQLVDQMTRLDTVRSVQIHMVTPDSVKLVDLTIQPYYTLDAMIGEGAGNEIEHSLLTHFSAREIADLSVFLLAQQPFFPQDDESWQRTKHEVARAAVPIALGALATGAAFDAGALSYSSNFWSRADGTRLGYYGGFRGLGVHMHPYLRAGLTARAFGFEAAAGLADQVNAAPTEPGQAVELALREGWLNQLVRPAGLDAFLEAAIKRSVGESASFTGDRTRGRGGLYWKRDQIPAFPTLALRGSVEGESNFGEALHVVAAVGVERPRSGITTVLQGSRVLAPPSAGVPDDARLNLFLAGSMEPVTALYSDEMTGLARRCVEEWAGLESLDREREAWERALLARGTASRSPEDLRATLAEMERILGEREASLLRVSAALADYLESRRRAYSILGRDPAPDDLHGPLDAAVLLGAEERVLVRLRDLARDLEGMTAPLLALRDRITDVEHEVRELEAADPGGAALAARRRVLDDLERRFGADAERVRAQLAAREQLHANGARILTALGRREAAIKQWDTLATGARLRLARLALTSGP